MVLLSACGGGSGDGPPEPGDVAVARVGDRAIWRSDVKREAVAQNLIAPEDPLATGSPVFRRVLDEVIDQRLLATEAERRGLDRSAEGERRTQAARDRALGDMLVEQGVNRAVSEPAVQALYREQLRLSRRGEQLRARQIVTGTEEEAQAIRRLLDAGGAFEQLATERSTDAATRFNGGDLGYFALSSMPTEYGTSLAAAQPGQLVGPFAVAPRAPGGAPTWAIVRVEDRRQQPAPTLQEARPQIRRFLSFDQISELVQTLRRGAQIRYLVPVSQAPADPVPPAPPSAPASTAVPAPAPASARTGSPTPTVSPGTAAPAPARPAQ